MDECIRSLNAQTYPNFRTLVVDNGSTDGSVEWLKEHQIDTIFLPENTGFSGAVNVGIKAADTPYVRWCVRSVSRSASFPSAAG